MKQNKIILNADRVSLMIEFTETIVQNRKASAEWVQSCYDVSYILYKSHTEERRETKEDWGVLSQHDWYWKALISQKKTDLRTILSDHYHEF
jgi:hypothetical protein